MNPVSTPATSAARDVELVISGMSCGHCVAGVRSALTDLPGVEVHHVAVGSASVAVDPTVTSVDALLAAVGEAGYEARVADRTLPQAGAGGCCSMPRR